MTRRFFGFLLLFFVCFFISPSIVSAHVLGGPPFLKVAGKYAQNDPYYQGITTLNIPQDLGSQTYLVGKPIHFEIDLDALEKQTALPPGSARNLSFRWSYAQGDNFDQVTKDYQYDRTVDYTFAASKSYLIIAEARMQGDSNYIIIDTVKVDVVPEVSYKTPQARVFVGTSANDADKPVLLVSETTFDPSVGGKRYLWDFGDGKLVDGGSVQRTFNTINAFSIGLIYLRVVDGHGFTSDVGFNVENVKSKLKFAPFGNMTSVPVTYGSFAQGEALVAGAKKSSGVERKQMSVVWYVGLGVVGLGFVGVWSLVRKRK